MPIQNLSAATIAVHRKQGETVELKLAGLSNQQIADRLRYRDRSAVSKAIAAALDRGVEVPRVQELRALYSSRIAAGYGVLMQILGRDYPKPDYDATPTINGKGQVTLPEDANAAAIEDLAELKLKAVDRSGRLLERESKLHGLDAPARTEVSGDGSITVSFHSALQPTVVEQNTRQLGS